MKSKCCNAEIKLANYANGRPSSEVCSECLKPIAPTPPTEGLAWLKDMFWDVIASDDIGEAIERQTKAITALLLEARIDELNKWVEYLEGDNEEEKAIKDHDFILSELRTAMGRARNELTQLTALTDKEASND